jgi:manganese transport protein
MVPAMAVIAVCGEEAVTRLLILSQVVLSLQLPFAVWPLVRFTGDTALMGEFANGRLTAALAWSLTAVLIGLNVYLVFTASAML